MKFAKASFVVTLLLVTTLALAWKVGDRILGQWGDNFWYPAKITGTAGANFNVSFDDGDKAVLPASKIKKINWKVGTKVQCNWKGGGKYYWGTITKKSGEKVHISYDDGDQEDTLIGRCRAR
jgi:hypothetical protein